MSSQSQQQLLEKIGVILSDLNVQYRTIEQQVAEDPKMSANLLYLNAKYLASHLRLFVQCQDVFNSAQQPTMGASLIQTHEDTEYLFLNKIKDDAESVIVPQSQQGGNADDNPQDEADLEKLTPFVKEEVSESKPNETIEAEAAYDSNLDKQGDNTLPNLSPEGSNTENSEIIDKELNTPVNTAPKDIKPFEKPVYYADLQNAMNESEPFPLSNDPKVHVSDVSANAGDDGVVYEGAEHKTEEVKQGGNEPIAGVANALQVGEKENVKINPGARGAALQLEEEAAFNNTNHTSFVQRAEEKLDAGKKSINDSFARSEDAQPNLTPIPDLKSGISLNDKLLFIRDLFSGYNLSYAEAIDNINKMDNFDVARNFLEKSYAQKNNWQSKPATVDKFYNLVSRRYL